ncbi:hypothetical protein [Reinekea sp. G2M2-21]|uniref:hypothetical protein n=1 Tax=Reinekea sp. G2M2-21 TaxID=2788942 RepID=UPI0018A972DE|nr:hypothetical protein [Reinekea sp. G2M2-21]
MDKLDILRLQCEGTLVNIMGDRQLLTLNSSKNIDVPASSVLDLPGSDASRIHAIRRMDTGLFCQLSDPASEADFRHLIPISELPIDFLVSLTSLIESEIDRSIL